MKFSIGIIAAAILLSANVFAQDMPQTKATPDGFVSMFDGKTLDNWDGDPLFWSVQDECITGISTAEKPIKYNSFLVFKGSDNVSKEPANFELIVDFCLYNHNSGIQYRSFMNDRPWSMGGYQGDIAGQPHMGIVYGENFRGILAQRGQKVVANADGSRSTESFVDSNEVARKINFNGWNTYRIVAMGNTLTQYINGEKVSELVDNDPSARDKGLIGFQMHVGPTMKVQFKNIFIKEIKD